VASPGTGPFPKRDVASSRAATDTMAPRTWDSVRKEIIMAWQTLTVMALGVAFALSGCSCDSGKAKALIRESGERWVLAGHYVNPRESGPPSEDWVGTCQLPDGTLNRLVDIPMKTPDGETVLFPTVAYCEPRKVLICQRDDIRDAVYSDVWRYDLTTGQSRWIAKGRWDNTCGFAWSPDGSKVAFMGSTRGTPVAVMQFDERNAEALKLLDRRDNDWVYYVSKDDHVMRVHVRTAVMQYDVHTDKLEEVAGDASRFGGSSVRPRRPAYSEDGNWLYYVSADRHVMRVDLGTRHCERLPFTDAIAVLTVRGEHLVYARGVEKGRDTRLQIVKVKLNAPDDSHSQQVYATRGTLRWNVVSPSRRFILFQWRYGYGGDRRLLDVERGKTFGGWGLLGEGGFDPDSTVFVGFAGP